MPAAVTTPSSRPSSSIARSDRSRDRELIAHVADDGDRRSAGAGDQRGRLRDARGVAIHDHRGPAARCDLAGGGAADPAAAAGDEHDATFEEWVHGPDRTLGLG